MSTAFQWKQWALYKTKSNIKNIIAKLTKSNIKNIIAKLYQSNQSNNQQSSTNHKFKLQEKSNQNQTKSNPIMINSQQAIKPIIQQAKKSKHHLHIGK